MKNARWLAKLGGHGYDLLIRINHIVNVVLHAFGRPRMSFSRRVKNSVKGAVNFISDFERTMADIAVHEGHHVVVCGHIHQPQMRTISTPKGTVEYLNSGDWIENLSALEYTNGRWGIYLHELATAAKERIPAGMMTAQA
jgi:UDP-2,3-diacylglucosamine pyrophosphatase LpxH